jgi:hypothetical protein
MHWAEERVVILQENRQLSRRLADAEIEVNRSRRVVTELKSRIADLERDNKVLKARCELLEAPLVDAPFSVIKGRVA